MEDASITSLKADFIRTQVRQLDILLEPSTRWRDLLPAPADEGQLSDKTIADLVRKVNEKIRQHNRLIFSTQSQRHVAEQIESLHWNLVSGDLQRAEADTVVILRDTELTDSQVIRSLPQEYDNLYPHPDHEEQEGEAERYNRLREGLSELSRKRDALKRKLAQYQELKRLMEPLNEPHRNVQPNLVTRDGELSQELDRMRVLMARVTGRINGTSDSRVDGEARQEEAPAPLTDQQKLARVIGLG
ncbi:kinetochore protein fta4 [Cladophialophora carrionii]|uniref:Kinetochore protein fta4 n=1 Tax=Cladophialophora carrionii TaxID=86049 RepID=A0A1C1CY44_9EURO|nr:kinetochore protein fta4 [Cladophialophora carrionii]